MLGSGVVKNFLEEDSAISLPKNKNLEAKILTGFRIETSLCY